MARTGDSIMTTKGVVIGDNNKAVAILGNIPEIQAQLQVKVSKPKSLVFVVGGHYADGEEFSSMMICEDDELVNRPDLHDDHIFFYGITRDKALDSKGFPYLNDFTITRVGKYV